MKSNGSTLLALGLAALAAASGARADWSLNRLGWDMTWADEFGGTNVDAAKWNVEDYGTPANNELQYYTPDCVYVENDVLVIRSDRNNNPEQYGGREFISGKLTTAGHFAQQYGYWEVRSLLPSGTGLWPAHWMLGYLGWPPEIDIMEMIGSVPWRIVMSVHWGPVAGDQKPWEIGQTGGGDYWDGDMTLDYHTYGLEWGWWGVKFYIDGVERASCYSGCPKEPMFFILNTAVGGDWPGYPWGTSFPRYHCVDYVRAWQACGGRSLLNAGFEEEDADRFFDWNAYEDGNVVRDEDPDNAHSGANAVKMYGRFDGSDNSQGIYQDIHAYPGEMVEGSFWVQNRPGDALAGSNTAAMKIEFLDGSQNLLSRYEFTVADSNGPSTYCPFVLRDIAPADTERARLVLEMRQAGYAAGAVNADDAAFRFVTPFTYRPLLNGGFETVYSNRFANWRATGDRAASEFLPTNVYEGSVALRLYEEASGSTGTCAVSQDLPARAGEDWTASVCARNRDGDPLTGTSYAFLRLEFLNSTGGVVGASEVTTVTASAAGAYTNCAVSAMAPAESAFARIVLGLWQDGAGTGSVVCDSADLAPLVTNESPQIINGDFERFDGTNYAGWTRYSGVGWNVLNDTNLAHTRSGTNAVWLFGQFPGGGENNYSGLYQDLPAEQGEVWESSVWARNRPYDVLQGSNAGRLKLEFLDAARTRIDYDQYSLITSNSPAYYEQAVIRRVAPTNTAYARVVLELKQAANAEGSVNFDDADLRHLTVQDDRTAANGGFETGEEGKFLNWSEWGNTGPNIVSEGLPTNILDGGGAVQMWGRYSGGYNECGLFQDVPAAPGEMWLASVWAKNRKGDALQGDNAARLKLEYLPAAGAPIGTNALTIVDAGSPDDEWHYFAIRHLVPDGASRARIVLQLNQDAAQSGGSVNFDAAAMRLVTDTDPERSVLNGGFEQGVADEFANWDRYGPAAVTNVFRDPLAGNARSGQVALQMHGSYDGATNQSGIFQNIPAREGELWEASVWARNRPGDAITGSNSAVLKLEFIDDGDAIIRAKTQTILDAGSSTNYREFVLRDRAPSGTKLARIVAEIEQVNYMPGSVNVDDFGFSVITAEDGSDIANGDLEDFVGSGFLNWSAYGNSGGNVIRDPQTNALGGVGAVQIWGEYTTWQSFSGLYQGVPAQEGQLWKATVWARNRPGDALQGNNQGRIKFDFLNGSGGIIGSYVMPVVTASSPTNYRQHALIAAAPAGAAEVRLVLELMQENGQGGSVNFDCASLEVIPEFIGTQNVQRTMLAGPLHPGKLDTLHFTGDLVLDSSAQLHLEIGGTNNALRMDRLDAAGACTLGGQLNIRMVQAFPPYLPHQGERLEILRATNVGGAFASFNSPAGEGGGDAFTLQVTATNVSLLAVRELDSDQDGLPDYWEQAHFHSILGGIAGLDADGDFMDNLGEYISDTSPTNGTSYLRVETAPPDDAKILRWNSSSGRVYSVLFRTSLVAAGWAPLATNLPATPTVNVYTDQVNADALLLYRIGVSKP